MISTTTFVKLIKHLDVTDLSGEKVMIDFSTGKYFLLKGSANDIWDILAEATDSICVQDIISSLMDICEVDHDTCCRSVLTVLNHLYNLDFISCENEQK